MRPSFRYGGGRIVAPVSGSTAAFSFGQLFATNAILQRDLDYGVWGRGTTGISVDVTIDTDTQSTIVDSNGVWRVTMPAHAPGGPFTLSATQGATTLTRTGVHFGDVIITIASQSNLASTVSQLATADYNAAIADAAYPQLRFYTVPTRAYAATPLYATPAAPTVWTQSSSTTIDEISSIAWLSARELHKITGIATGIVAIYEGGSTLQHWLPAEALAAFVDVADQLPVDPVDFASTVPVIAWNGMVAPSGPYACKALLQYLGESAGSSVPGRAFFERQLGLVYSQHRAHYGVPNSTLAVSISLPNSGSTVQTLPIETNHSYAEIRESINAAARTDGNAVAIATADDTADFDLHPMNKPKVANRVLLAFREYLLADGSVGTCPRVLSTAVVGSTLELTMSTSAFAPASPQGFAITNSARTTWFMATATKSGSKIILSHASVPTPAYWRYSWANNPIGDVHETVNNLPLDSCRNDVEYFLQVTGGTGDGQYMPGTVVTIAATLSAGQGISQWAGDIAALTNPFAATTTVTMPNHDVDVAARIGIEPAVAITAPAGGAALPVGTPVTVSGTQSTPDPGGGVASVEVFLGATSLGLATLGSGTWSLSWTPTIGQSGAGLLTAVALGTNNVPKTSASVSVAIGDAINDAINAILALSPTVFRLFKSTSAYAHEDATNAGHTDRVIDLVASPAKDLTNSTDASQPIFSSVGLDTAVQTVRADVRFLSEPTWGSSATNLTEALAVKCDLAGVTQYMVSRDGAERSWVQDVTNIVKFTLSSLANYVATSALDTNPHLLIATYDGTQATPANRAKIYVDGVDDTHITGTIPASLTAIATARFGSSTTGATAGSHKFLAHVGWTRTLNSTELATLRTNLKVLCVSLP